MLLRSTSCAVLALCFAAASASAGSPIDPYVQSRDQSSISHSTQFAAQPRPTQGLPDWDCPLTGMPYGVTPPPETKFAQSPTEEEVILFVLMFGI